MIDYAFDDTAKKTRCSKLHAIHILPQGVLPGPYSCSFSNDNLSISVNQNGRRNISVIAKNETNADELITAYQGIEKLLMLLDGRFIPLDEFHITNAEDFSQQYVARRPAYSQSADFMQYPDNMLLNFDTILTEDLYKTWLNIIAEADIMHQVFLMATAAHTYANDIKLAFMIETAESLVMLVKQHTFYFTTLEPDGGRGTTLRMCIDGLITIYGVDIFERELNNDYAVFLQKVTNSRVRIMHIKNNVQKPYFKREENLLYLVKFCFLYRRILLELLGIPYSSYSVQLISAINAWEAWYDQNKQ